MIRQNLLWLCMGFFMVGCVGNPHRGHTAGAMTPAQIAHVRSEGRVTVFDCEGSQEKLPFSSQEGRAWPRDSRVTVFDWPQDSGAMLPAGKTSVFLRDSEEPLDAAALAMIEELAAQYGKGGISLIGYARSDGGVQALQAALGRSFLVASAFMDRGVQLTNILVGARAAYNGDSTRVDIMVMGK